jgi:hypothetical protein
MLTIRPEQMLELKRGYEEHLLIEYPARLRSAFPELLANVTRDALKQVTRQDVEAASGLDIEDEADVWRFVCLRYRMGSRRASPLHMGVVGEVLQNLDWSAKKRLDFIDHYVLSRM